MKCSLDALTLVKLLMITRMTVRKYPGTPFVNIWNRKPVFEHQIANILRIIGFCYFATRNESGLNFKA